MDEKKFLEQVHSKIKKRENLNIELRDTCIEIDDGKSVVFKIDSKGGMFYSADNRFIVLDIIHREIRSDEIYKKIADGEINENVQINGGNTNEQKY